MDYALNQPNAVIKLPAELKEISGIAFFGENKLACVQDEKGTIFIYDFQKRRLKKSFDFAANKDYEAIASVHDTIFVLRSNGDIFEIDQPESETENSVIHHTFLSKANNCEGLCYDEKYNRLLIACKGKPEKGTTIRGVKAVYGFDLRTKQLSETPVYIINPDSVKALILRNTERTGWFEQMFPSDKSKDFYFEPSEIAIEPGTDDVYVLSSVNKTLLVLSGNGYYKCAERLDPKIYKQPEGLTFSNNGELLISDEGKDKKANLIFLSRER